MAENNQGVINALKESQKEGARVIKDDLKDLADCLRDMKYINIEVPFMKDFLFKQIDDLIN